MGQTRSTVAARSRSLPEPVSITARPAVACGTNTFTSPSPCPRQNAATAAVRSVTRSDPVSTCSSRVSTTFAFDAGANDIERVLEISRIRAGEFDPSVIAWVRESQPHGVQPLAGKPHFRRERWIGSVGEVADTRMPLRRHVDPDLMGATCLELDL